MHVRYAGIDGGFCSAVADGLDFLNGVRNLHEPQRTGKQMGLEVCAQTKAHDGYIIVVHNTPELIDLCHGQELAFVHNDYVALAQVFLLKPSSCCSRRWS